MECYSHHVGSGDGSGSMTVLVVVEDDPDVQFLIETVFSQDPRFTFGAMATAAEDALSTLDAAQAGVIVLDHGLSGELTGLEAAPQLKVRAPLAKIILFTAHAELRPRADREAAIDAFILKTDARRLLPVAQELTGIGPRPA